MSAGKDVKRAFDNAISSTDVQITNEAIATNTVLINRVSIANGRVQALEAENTQLRQSKKKLEKQVDELEDGINKLKRRADGYESVMAEWAVSQKAFKQLAIELGIAQGMSREDVTAMIFAKQMDVLDNKNPADYGTNAASTSFVQQRVDQLRELLIARKKKKEEDALADQTFDRDFAELVSSSVLYRIGEEPGAWAATFNYWLALAQAGNAPAQHNVGWCYRNGKGTPADRRESETWFLEALEQGVPATPYCLYQDNYWENGWFKGKTSIGRRCVDAGVSLEQAWAIEVDRKIKEVENMRAEEAQRKAMEEDLFNKVSRFVVGARKPVELLQEISSLNSERLNAACALYDCDVKIVRRDMENIGGFFKRNDIADYYVVVVNPTDRNVYFRLEYPGSGILDQTTRMVPAGSTGEFKITKYKISIKSQPQHGIWLHLDALRLDNAQRAKK